MIYVIDIDNTICHTNGNDYLNSVPILDRIDKINKLYNHNTIVYWTARGADSGKDWSDFTKKQLDEWGCLRHKLLTNKPKYDLWVDDKCINAGVFFNET